MVDKLVLLEDGGQLKAAGPARIIRSFTTAMTQANFATMVSDMTIDIIEMAAGTYQDWHHVVLDVDRSARPLLIRPAPGAAVIWDGTTDDSTDGLFYFGVSAKAAYIIFDPAGTGGSFTIQKYNIGQTALVNIIYGDHIAINGFSAVLNTASAASGATRWTVCVSSDGIHRSNDLTFNDWVSVSGDAYFNHLQIKNAYSVDRFIARHWRTSGGYYGAYLGGDGTDIVLDDWNMYGHTYVGIEVNNTEVTLRNIAADSTCAVNIYDTTYVDGGGNHVVPTTLRLAKPSSNAYIDITCGDVTTTFNGNDTDGWMDYLFKSNGVTKVTIHGDTGNVAISGSLTVNGVLISAAGLALIDDANATAQIATLGLDADIATLALPANTTISAAGAALIDDADAAAQRTTLGAAAKADVDALILGVF